MQWIAGVRDDEIFLSAVTLGELQAGIELTRDRDPAKAEELERWVDLIEGTQTVLPLNGAIFRTWARLMRGRSDDLIEDAMIAATAIVHGLKVATRNVRDFERLGVDVVNPFAS